jgi:hypothetical protein
VAAFGHESLQVPLHGYGSCGAPDAILQVIAGRTGWDCKHKLCNKSPSAALTLRRSWREATMNGKSMLIGALVVAVGVLGYLYWDSQHNTVLKVPGVTIKKN